MESPKLRKEKALIIEKLSIKTLTFLKVIGIIYLYQLKIVFCTKNFIKRGFSNG